MNAARKMTRLLVLALRRLGVGVGVGSAPAFEMSVAIESLQCSSSDF